MKLKEDAAKQDMKYTKQVQDLELKITNLQTEKSSFEVGSYVSQEVDRKRQASGKRAEEGRFL